MVETLASEAGSQKPNNGESIFASVRSYVSDAYSRRNFCAVVYAVFIFTTVVVLQKQESSDFPVLHPKVSTVRTHRLHIESRHYERLLRLPSLGAGEVQPLPFCKFFISPVRSVSDINEALVKRYSLEAMHDSARNITDPRLVHFYPLLTLDIKLKLLTLYLVLADALNKAGVQHYMADGALLGIYRMSGILPWDDDLDVVVSIRRWKEVRQALSCIVGYDLDVSSPERWVFFPSDGNVTLNNKHKKFPFIDIFFYQEDATYIIILHWLLEFRIPFNKRIVFPLRSAVMEGLKVPVPFDMYAYLLTAFEDLSTCSSQQYLHNRKVTNYSMVTVACSDLFPLYGRFRLTGRNKPLSKGKA